MDVLEATSPVGDVGGDDRSVSSSPSDCERIEGGSGDEGGEGEEVAGGGEGVSRTGVRGSSLGRKAELISPIPTKKSSTPQLNSVSVRF